MAGWGYDVVGALDATPGTEALRAVAARVEQVDGTALADLGRRFASLADGMDDSVRAVGRRGDGVAEAWQGPGADAFARYTADFARAGSGTGTAARQVQRELSALGRTLQTLREEVAAHVSDALDLAATRTDAAEVRTAVAGPTARAQAALERAEQEVTDSARRLRGLTSGMSGFSRLRSPDAGVMSSSGASARWSDRQGATIGADDPVQAARIVDGSDSGPGTGGEDLPDDEAGQDGAAGVGQDEATGRDDGTGQDEVTGQDEGTGQDERGSRADASDPGNEGRYDTGDSGSSDDDRADPSQDDDAAGGSSSDGSSSDDATSEDGGDDRDDRDEGASTGGDDGTGDDEKADDTDEKDTDEKDTDDTAADAPATGTASSSGQGPGGGPPGQVGDWIREATAILAENGVDPGDMDPDDIATIIDHESGGDPDAVNDWDSNADKGTPSKGLMQTIGPTFEANKLPGHDSITDPVDNIIAAVRYAVKRYGSVSSVPGVEAVARGDSYVGY